MRTHPLLRGGMFVFLAANVLYFWLVYNTPERLWFKPEQVAQRRNASLMRILGMGLLSVGVFLQRKQFPTKETSE